jgi:mRNA-degrading endonuclease RelE of RelBE toxin-antitoxin system
VDFRIADTFTDSLARLTGEEQKLVKTTAFDLQLNPVNPGMSFHKLDKAKDKNFWSVRVSRDIRLIVHKTATSLLLCYVDHHDDMSTSALVTKSISKSGRNAGVLAPAGQKTLTDIYLESDEYQRAKRYNEIFRRSSRKRDGPGCEHRIPIGIKYLPKRPKIKKILYRFEKSGHEGNVSWSWLATNSFAAGST